MRRAAATLVLLPLVGCVDTAIEDAMSGTAAVIEAADSGGDGAGRSDARSLTFAHLPDGCDVLSREVATALLEETATRRPGGDCAWSSESGFVRLLYSNQPLDRFDSRRDDDGVLAAELRQVAQLDAAPTAAGEVGGGPAFAAEKGDVSVLFAVPGIRTTAMLSDRPIGEIVIILSLRSPQAHAERLKALDRLASEAVNALRQAAG